MHAASKQRVTRTLCLCSMSLTSQSVQRPLPAYPGMAIAPNSLNGAVTSTMRVGKVVGEHAAAVPLEKTVAFAAAVVVGHATDEVRTVDR